MHRHYLTTALAVVALSGCAAQSSDANRSAADPWEPVNRSVYAVNDVLDRAIVKPVAKGYEFVFPAVIRKGVTNFYRNTTTPLTALNNLLQGKGAAASNDLGRFLLNSTFGIGGIIDLATPAGFDRNDEDFGQTLAVWGVPAGPYVVLPGRGPSTLRDALMLPLNAAADPVFWIDDASVRDKLIVLGVIDARQRLFAAEELIGESPDRYVTIRESYLQNRNYEIHDGDLPADDDPYSDLEDFEDPE